jgi:hypothetical protein
MISPFFNNIFSFLILNLPIWVTAKNLLIIMSIVKIHGPSSDAFSFLRRRAEDHQLSGTEERAFRMTQNIKGQKPNRINQ